MDDIFFAFEYALDGGLDVRLLLSIEGYRGEVGWIKASRPEFTVVDEGRFVERTGVAVADTAATTDPTQNYTKTYNASWVQSYTGAGGQRADGAASAYQGYTPYWPGGGRQRSLIGFPTLTGDLSGATVTKVEVYLYFQHWHSGAGGSAGIGYHGNTSRPATFGGSTGILAYSHNWPRGAGRWVTIPSGYWDAFRTGAARGISLQAPNDTTQYYGYAAGSGSQIPKLRISYRK